jgi:anti-sigma-K factor RskA
MIAMYDRLLGYLFGCLDPEECREIEAALQTDDSLRVQLEILRRCAHPLEADRIPLPPPKDLAAKTCQRLRGVRGQGAGGGQDAGAVAPPRPPAGDPM